MIKLPILLSEHDTWQGAVSGAIAARASLAASAKDEPDHVRPLVLLQAQPKDQEVTVEALTAHLTEVEGIPREKIAVATGDQRELDGIDLFDRACRIEYVVTIEALKEGWDCSFAYVFCSVARIRSAVDVEQLLGRVLRMPYAARRKVPALNRAYAFVSEASFGAAAQALADRLAAMGFEEDEAHDQIEPAPGELVGPGGLFGPFDPPEEPETAFRHTVAAPPPEAPSALKALERGGGVTVRETVAGEIEIAGRIDGGLEEAVRGSLPEGEQPAFARAVEKHRRDFGDRPGPPRPPAGRGDELEAPRLMSAAQGVLEFADTDLFGRGLVRSRLRLPRGRGPRPAALPGPLEAPEALPGRGSGSGLRRRGRRRGGPVRPGHRQPAGARMLGPQRGA